MPAARHVPVLVLHGRVPAGTLLVRGCHQDILRRAPLEFPEELKLLENGITAAEADERVA